MIKSERMETLKEEKKKKKEVVLGNHDCVEMNIRKKQRFTICWKEISKREQVRVQRHTS
jgi:hypothetical protein